MGLQMIFAAKGTEAAGKFIQAHEEKKQGKRSEKIAALGQQQTEIETEEKARELGRRSRQLKGEQIVRFLKSGVRLKGSALDILKETDTLGQQDVDAARRGGAARAANIGLQGKIQRKQRNINARGLMLAGFGDVLSLGADAAGAFGGGS